MIKNDKWHLTLQCTPSAKYTIEDCRIARIEADQLSIQFIFPDGIWDTTADARTTFSAQLSVQCLAEDVLVTVYHEHKIGKRKWYTIRYPNLSDIISALNRHSFEIEIIACLSSDQRLFLRGEWKEYIFEFDLLNVKEAHISF